jgi:hypothetical protein
MLDMNEFSKMTTTAPIETVRPAAINPDSIAVVLLAKRMMRLFMFSAPDRLDGFVQTFELSIASVRLVVVRITTKSERILRKPH